MTACSLPAESSFSTLRTTPPSLTHLSHNTRQSTRSNSLSPSSAVAAAANYFVLGRTLYYIPWASPLDPRRATQIFIFLDWLIGIFAAVGLSHVYRDGNYNVSIGNGFVRASLVLQIVLYGFYLLILGIWHRRAVQAKVEGKRPLAGAYLAALYACGVLVLVRCVYRTTEYFQGAEGWLALHEAFYYVFDALPIFGMILLLNIFHPGKFFPEDSSVYLASDGVTEVKGPGWSDERRWWWTIIDPLGVADWVKRDKSQPKFWEVDGQEARQSVDVSVRQLVA